MGGRRRSRGKIDRESEDDEHAKAVVFISSSDDEEANKDFSLDIVERAMKRRRAPGDLSKSLDLIPPPAKDAEVQIDRRLEEKEEKKMKQKKKPKKPNKKVVEPQIDALAKEEEQLGMTDSGVNDASDAPHEGMLVMEEEPAGASDSIITNMNVPSNNVVLRKLLRGRRYFDPGDHSVGACYNCGEEGHVAINCVMERRQKPCFICGMFGHNAKSCTQGQDCFICKRRGHFAKDCPDKYQRGLEESKICLRCGESGHEMSSCKNDYAPEDMKEIKCYVCQKFGHLCCANFMDKGAREVFCYNCAQSGHTGLGCAKPRGEVSADTTSKLCYKCGEGGHFARGCTKNMKFERRTGDIFTPVRGFDVNAVPRHRRFSEESGDPLGSRSLPSHFEKTPKNRSSQPEGRRNAISGKSRTRGGWTIDPGDLPKVKAKAKANGLISPTSAKKTPKLSRLASSGPHSNSSPIKKHKPFLGTPVSRVSFDSYKPVFSASRFGSFHGRHRNNEL